MQLCLKYVAMKWWLFPYSACSTRFRGFFGYLSFLIWRIHFVLLSLILFSISIYLELYSDLLVSSLRANPWPYGEFVSWSVLVQNRLCHKHHFQWHLMNLWFKGGTLMWIFQWVRWKYPCSPSMNDLPVTSVQEIGKNLYFYFSTSVVNLIGPKLYWEILSCISCHV